MKIGKRIVEVSDVLAALVCFLMAVGSIFTLYCFIRGAVFGTGSLGGAHIMLEDITGRIVFSLVAFSLLIGSLTLYYVVYFFLFEIPRERYAIAQALKKIRVVITIDECHCRAPRKKYRKSHKKAPRFRQKKTEAES